jgi:hypothetical protein
MIDGNRCGGVFYTSPMKTFSLEVNMKYYSEEAVAFYKTVQKFKRQLGISDDKICLKVIANTPDLLTDFLYQVRESTNEMKAEGVWKH